VIGTTLPRQMGIKQAARSVVRRLGRFQKTAEPPEITGKAGILDAYVTDPPSHEHSFKLFEGEWSSDIPGYGFGHARLFDDHRIRWFDEQSGGLKGKRILELGPLEGAHTYMMARAGAASIVSIEANTRAFLKCLIVQNALKFEADFRLGDFRPYLASCADDYDLLVASGVLYHMAEPVTLLRDAARVCRAVGIWTHYYDPAIILGQEQLRVKFDAEPRCEQVGSRQVVSYRYSYLDALQWQGFCGGSAPTSYWLTRDSLLGALTELGFDVVVGEDARDHPNGPALLLYAKR
jgi:SAM-dependent methyltransferase